MFILFFVMTETLKINIMLKCLVYFHAYMFMCLACLHALCTLCTCMSCMQGIIQTKLASSSWTLPLVLHDRKVPFLPKIMLF